MQDVQMNLRFKHRKVDENICSPTIELSNQAEMLGGHLGFFLDRLHPPTPLLPSPTNVPMVAAIPPKTVEINPTRM